MSADVAMLAEVPLLSLLDDQERRTLAGILETKHFDKGDTIFSVGDAGECLYVVASGRVEAYLETPEGEKIVLTAIEPGGVLTLTNGLLTAFGVLVIGAIVIVGDVPGMVLLLATVLVGTTFGFWFTMSAYRVGGGCGRHRGPRVRPQPSARAREPASLGRARPAGGAGAPPAEHR